MKSNWFLVTLLTGLILIVGINTAFTLSPVPKVAYENGCADPAWKPCWYIYTLAIPGDPNSVEETLCVVKTEDPEVPESDTESDFPEDKVVEEIGIPKYEETLWRCKQGFVIEVDFRSCCQKGVSGDPERD